MLMVGSPGTGKSMLAKRLPSILPSMSLDEALETAKGSVYTSVHFRLSEPMRLGWPFQWVEIPVLIAGLFSGRQSVPSRFADED